MSLNPNGAPPGYYYQSGATAYIEDPAGTYSAGGATAPTPADPGSYIPVTGATSSGEEIVDLPGTYSDAGASAPTLAAAGAYIPAIGATSSAAEIVDLAGSYSAAGASASTADPAGTYSGAGASAPTLSDPGTYIPIAGATSSAAEIIAPAGTYAPPGASAPIADPGGTFSAAGASAPKTDPAGSYTSPYALTRLFLVGKNTTPDNSVLSFNSVTAVANYYGATSREAVLANEFFATYGASATMLFTRTPNLRRPHLLGANISDVTLKQLQHISGSLAVYFDGFTYSGLINLSGVDNFPETASAIQATLNANLPIAAVTTGSSITPVAVSFTGSFDRAYLTVTAITSGVIEIGSYVSGTGVIAGSQIVNQVSGTPGGIGIYTLFVGTGLIASETMTDSYGILTVGSVSTGAVALGEQVTGAGVPSDTGIEDNLSGSGAGSTWVVDLAPGQTIADATLTMTAPPLSVVLHAAKGATENNDYFDVTGDPTYGFDFNPSTISFMSGTAATALGLSQDAGAVDSASGGQQMQAAEFMSILVAYEDSEFGSFQNNIAPGARGSESVSGLEAWAQSTDFYKFLSTYTSNTAPAGQSGPTRDPAGTYSGAGATAPTLAAPGTYIPVAGANSATAEIVDPAGTYSLAGASAPTLAQPGYYVATTGASSETLDSPGYYTPDAGATAQMLALPSAISGTQSGQSTASGQSDTPFASAMISDPNIETTDTLSIQITGGGGILSDGAGFDGLTVTGAGVYTLTGTAAAVASELEALVFTPNTYSATTTFTLTDTTSLGTSATDANTTVTVTNGQPVVVSVSTFLANQASLNKTPGGFDILDTAAEITANLNQLADPHINEITISDNGQIGASIGQLSSDTRATHELENANGSNPLIVVTDTAADIQAGLSTLLTYKHEIASVIASNGTVVVSAATFLTDQPVLDKIVSGYAISDSANDIAANLDQLDDPHIAAITVSNNGVITVSVGQLITDATAIADLVNANASPVMLAIADTAGDVQTGLATLVADTGEIGSITTSYGPIIVSAATFVADQSTLDKIAGGFDVADSSDDLIPDLSMLDADPNVDAITADIGDPTLSGGVGVNAPIFSETGYGTSLTVSEALSYSGTFSQGVGTATSISAGDSFSLTGTAALSGATSGAGTLALAGGTATIGVGATISVSQWSISGSGTEVTLDENLYYAGSFSEGAGDTFVVSGGYLLLNGAASFAGATVYGSNILYTEGPTTVSGLLIGGTIEWENTNSLTQSGGSATIGDARGDEAFLFNSVNATYDILDDSDIRLGASTASYINDTGLFEKTGGTATSVIAPSFSEGAVGTVAVASGTLSFSGAVNSFAGAITGAGTLQLAGGSDSINSNTISVANLSISGSSAVTLARAVTYAGGFSEGAGDILALVGGSLTLMGANAAFSGATVDGSKFLFTEGTTAVSGLTIGGTVEWENTNVVNESGGSATIGDANGDEAILYNTPKATYDILDNGGIGVGSSTASYIDNAGLLEKTGGTGASASAIAPAVVNAGTIEVTTGTLDMQGGVSGNGSDEISGASTLEFDSTVAGQAVLFAGSGGTLDLASPQGFASHITGFDTVGTNDAIDVAAPWVFSGFTENAAGTQGTLGFLNGASSIGLTLLGDYNPALFTPKPLTNGGTQITYI